MSANDDAREHAQARADAEGQAKLHDAPRSRRDHRGGGSNGRGGRHHVLNELVMKSLKSSPTPARLATYARLAAAAENAVERHEAAAHEHRDLADLAVRVNVAALRSQLTVQSYPIVGRLARVAADLRPYTCNGAGSLRDAVNSLWSSITGRDSAFEAAVREVDKLTESTLAAAARTHALAAEVTEVLAELEQMEVVWSAEHVVHKGPEYGWLGEASRS